MTTKLTLNMEKSILDEAKKFALVNNLNLNKLVESFFTNLIDEKKNFKKDIPISDFVKSISLKVDLPVDFNYKDEIAQLIDEKYK